MVPLPSCHDATALRPDFDLTELKYQLIITEIATTDHTINC